jgi:hypothetical protein
MGFYFHNDDGYPVLDLDNTDDVAFYVNNQRHHLVATDDLDTDDLDTGDTDVWQLRAAYIDAFAAYLHATGPTDGTDLVAARDALVAATTGHKVT